MSNEFVGSNNIPLFYRDGMFGCLDPETPVLLWEGSSKKAKDIVVGDLLIGDDGNKRTVKRLTYGRDQMYKIHQKIGKDYVVNSQHILTLHYEKHKKIVEGKNCISIKYFDERTMQVKTNSLEYYDNLSKDDAVHILLDAVRNIPDEPIFDIRIEKYMDIPDADKENFKGIKMSNSVSWQKRECDMDPYDYALAFPDIGDNIATEYVVNDDEMRLRLIAGFIDGFENEANHIRGHHYFVISGAMYSKSVRDRIIFVIGSLGFKHFMNDSKDIFIFGNRIHEIPSMNRKDEKKYREDYNKISCEIKVSEMGEGEFVGWSVDGNERFLLGDFTITHNSRLEGGQDAASPRYIFTKMEPLTPLIFRDEDDVLLDYVEDDGDIVEPRFYVPIIPMILVNGCSGIGTGYSSSVPNFNPLDLIENIKIWLENDGNVLSVDEDNISVSLFSDMVPWYRGFTGIIEKEENNRYITKGILNKERNVSTITELPVGLWTNKFKEICETFVENKDLKSMKNYSTPNRPNFILTESNDGFSCSVESLKLHSYLYTSNMVLFNEHEQIRKFMNVDEILNYFCGIRYSYYIKRKAYILKSLHIELKFLQNKARFIQEIIDIQIDIMNVEEEDVIQMLEERGYDKQDDTFEYLLRLQVRTFTSNKVRQINQDVENVNAKIRTIESTSEKQMWINELDEFKVEYEKWLVVMNNLENKFANKAKGAKASKKAKK